MKLLINNQIHDFKQIKAKKQKVDLKHLDLAKEKEIKLFS